jgi:F0F1-type ATP synthase assembly protein I
MSEDQPSKKDPTLMQAMGIVWEVVFLVALPTLFFGLIGRWLDRHFGTTPLFLAIGLLLTLVVLTVIVTKRGKDIAKKL